MTRTDLPLVRYTAKMPVPPTDKPRLKNRFCAVNRAESGSNRTAKGSSNDSSISLIVIARLRLKGGLFQSKSMTFVILTCKVYPTPIHCIYDVFTDESGEVSRRFFLGGKLSAQRWICFIVPSA